MKAAVIPFPSRVAVPAVRQPQPAIVVVLPVIRIERPADPPEHLKPFRRRRRRKQEG